jgi:cell wall-associated NlpC family hydrolase
MSDVASVDIDVRARIVQAARSLIGVKYVHQGRSRFGIDCAGVVVHAGAATGIPIEDHTVYPGGLNLNLMLEYLSKNAIKTMGKCVPAVSIPRGSIVLFLHPRIQLCHVGIKTEGASMVHSWKSTGKVTETPIDSRWHRVLESVWDFKGVS